MQLKKICLLSRDLVLKEQLEAIIADEEWRLLWQPSMDIQDIQSAACDIILLGDDFWTAMSSEELAEWKKKLPTAQVVMLSSLNRRREMQRLLHACAEDYLILPLDSEEVLSVLHKCEERVQAGLAKNTAQGKVVVCFSPLGRSGKTSLALNLAVALSEQEQAGVALLDFTAPFGDIIPAVGLTAGESVDSLIATMTEEKEVSWRDKLTVFNGYRVWIGPAAGAIAEPDALNYEKTSAFLESLKKQFAFVVIDTTAEFRDVVIAALDAADKVLLLAVLEQVPSVKNIKVCLEIFHSLGYDEDKVKLILNRATAKYNLQARDVERIINYPIVWRLPNDFAVMRQSLTTKVPCVSGAPESHLSVEVRKLAEALRSGSWEQEQQSEWKRFAKWFS